MAYKKDAGDQTSRKFKARDAKKADLFGRIEEAGKSSKRSLR